MAAAAASAWQSASVTCGSDALRQRRGRNKRHQLGIAQWCGGIRRGYNQPMAAGEQPSISVGGGGGKSIQRRTAAWPN